MSRDERRYYVSGVNVAESSISEEYSMKFDVDQSHAKFAPKANQSQALNPQSKPVAVDNTQPRLLHEYVFRSIRDRYMEIKRMATNDADQLYQFYMFYRKGSLEGREKGIESLEKAITELRQGTLRPEFQPKLERLLKRLQFQKILNYQPNDVYYTLLHEQKKMERDKEIDQALRRKEEQMSNKQKPPRRMSAKVMNRLYPQQETKLTAEQQEEVHRLKFGKKLLQIYNQRQDFEAKELSVDQLYSIWVRTPDKMEYGLEADSEEVRGIIRDWMHGNIQNLAEAYLDKKGVKTDEAKILYKFLYEMGTQSVNYYQIFIPPNGFDVFYAEYVSKRNLINKNKLQQDLKKSQMKERQDQKRKDNILKRPISSTPLSILSQPKNKDTSQILQLIKKYPNDKELKRILLEKATPLARRPEQYGVHSQQEEMRIKNRLKQQLGKDPHKAAQAIVLNNTVMLQTQENSSTLMTLLNNERLEEDKCWNQNKDILAEALKVDVYNNQSLNPVIHQFAGFHLNIKNPSGIQNNTLIDKIVHHLDQLKSNPRQSRLQNLKSMVLSAKREAVIKEVEDKASEDSLEKQQKRKFYRFLTEWAKTYMENIILSKPAKESRSQFLKQFYQKALELHRPYLDKHFPVYQQKEEDPKNIYSPLLKYEFYKMVKDIDPNTMLKDQSLKNSAWTPAGKSDGLSTFNRLAMAYTTKSHLPDKKDEKTPDSIWGKDKKDQRIKFMMKMSDAVECTFKPTVHKMP